MFLLFLLGTSVGFMLFSMLAAFLIRKAVLFYERQSEQFLTAMGIDNE